MNHSRIPSVCLVPLFCAFLLGAVGLGGCGDQGLECEADADCQDCAHCHNGVCLPNGELCGDGLDNDCDGQTDEQCNPCEGITCDSPPDNACLDESTLRVYQADGACLESVCDYAYQDVDCALGCDAVGAVCAGCQHECPGGGTVCDQGESRECVTDANGCLVWGEPQACPDGYCLDGQSCGTCDDTCNAAGQVECQAGQFRTCVADPNGCLEFGAWATCASGFCADASSCGSCDDTCPAAGQVQCSQGSIRLCEADLNGCLAWGGDSACAYGFCLNATTCGQCDSDCPAQGATECTQGVIRECLADANGCLHWGGSSACPEGFCADAATCGACQHACASLGLTDCSQGSLRTCETDALGCRVWGDPVACPEGFCMDGTSCGNCDNQCQSGEHACTQGALSTCTADADGCLDWSAPQACPEGFCADAATCGTCDNTCPQQGQTRCAQGLLEQCEADVNGCLSWGAATACPDGFCADGATCGQCNSDCPQDGLSECDQGQIRTCSADGNGCLHWGPQTDCPSGFCQDAQICGSCDNTCPQQGDGQCSAAQLQTCEADGNGCLAWSVPQDCPEGFCADAQSCGTCDDTCPQVGDSLCESGQLQVCEADGNGCMAWSAPQDCPEGFCADGQTCGGCDDTCPGEGQTRCEAGGMQTCEADGNGCLAWSAPVACADGYCADAQTCGACSPCAPLEYCGGVWWNGNRYDTIGQAVAVAGRGNTVQICAGIYHEQINLTQAIHLAGAGPADTIIDGGGLGPVVSIDNDSQYFTEFHFTGLTLVNGSEWGLRVNSEDVDVFMDQCVVRDNDGGGMLLRWATLTDVEVSGNIDRGIQVFGPAHLNATNLRVLDNTSNSEGAGLFLHHGVNAYLSSSQFLRNVSQVRGGGVYLYGQNTHLYADDMDFGVGVDENLPDDVAINYYTGYPFHGYPYYAHLGAGEDISCVWADQECVQNVPSQVGAGSTSAHCGTGLGPVDVNGLGQYPDVATALYHAPEGSWVSVCAGTYEGYVRMRRSAHLLAMEEGVVLRGLAGEDDVVLRIEPEIFYDGFVPLIVATLAGLEITAGDKGGLWIRSAEVNVSDCDVHHNSGVGLLVTGGFMGRVSDVELTDVILRDNVSNYDGGSGGHGGGIRNAGRITGTRVSILDNYAEGGGGGAWLGGSGQPRLTLTDSSILRNSTDGSGGGIELFSTDDTQVVTVRTDFGVDVDDNSPSDVTLSGSPVLEYTEYGDETSVTCIGKWDDPDRGCIWD